MIADAVWFTIGITYSSFAKKCITEIIFATYTQNIV